jgi:quercetin dioxygenase-like cupin family protein
MASSAQHPEVREVEQSSTRIAAKIGRTIRRLRVERGLTLQEVSDGARVSASFVGALERGETDIAIGRLERIADFFGEDLSAILGYSREEVRFNYVPAEDWTEVSDGQGVVGSECSVPGSGLHLTRLLLAPGAEHVGRFPTDATVTVYLMTGALQIAVSDRLFHLSEGDAGSFKSDKQHLFINKSDAETAALLGVNTRS